MDFWLVISRASLSFLLCCLDTTTAKETALPQANPHPRGGALPGLLGGIEGLGNGEDGGQAGMWASPADAVMHGIRPAHALIKDVQLTGD